MEEDANVETSVITDIASTSNPDIQPDENEQYQQHGGLIIPFHVTDATSNRETNALDHEFQPALIVNTKRKREASTQESDSGDELTYQCPICFENWSNSGAHKIVSMKCGHLFGLRYTKFSNKLKDLELRLTTF